ncbi:hypothetical protein Fuma_01563 [Fuerstiella marisgermanici]|uniref:Uncharacterized protein n=1 Tax=Fuerstiella marisgermanici TaxID=1891926 RepID=A0A1P8WD40_9PLAN|nr:hypothetical protein Fuma_01563 [Fuerstiella marisgermanici]
MCSRLIAVALSLVSLTTCIGFICRYDNRYPAKPAIALPVCGLEQIQYFPDDSSFDLQEAVMAARQYKLEH